MDFETWKLHLAVELGRLFDMDGAGYIDRTGDDCWREAFNDGLSPREAAEEEHYAARTSV